MHRKSQAKPAPNRTRAGAKESNSSRDALDPNRLSSTTSSRGRGKAHGQNAASRLKEVSDKVTLPDHAPELQRSRVFFALSNLIGTKVQVTVRNGLVYEGIFSSTNEGSDLGVLLRMAHIKDSPSKSTIIKCLMILPKDVCSITAKALDSTAATRLSSDREVQIDSTIAGRSGTQREKPLQKWSSEDGFPILSGLDDLKAPTDSWDQFATNEKLFGVTTDFDEHLYTTKVDRSDPTFKQRELEAIRLAKEIEKNSAGNVQHQDLRGSSSKMDEEERYSAVIRQTGKYIPPGARKATQPNLNKQVENQPKKLDVKQTQEDNTATDGANLVGLAVSNPRSSDVRTPDMESSKTPQAGGAQMPAINKVPQKKSGIHVEAGEVSKNPVEASYIAKLFKDFAVGEKEMLMQRKHVLMKQEKDQIVEEFKNFSKSFKLKTPMPGDLQEILNRPVEKDVHARDSPPTRQTKGQNAASSSTNSPAVGGSPGNATKPSVAEETPKPTALNSSTPASLTTAPPVTSTSKVTPKTGFKFNVAATEFTPSGMGAGSLDNLLKVGGSGDKRTPRNQVTQGTRSPYGKAFPKNNTSPKPLPYATQYPEEFYGQDPQYMPYAMAPYQYRPMMGRPFVPGLPGMNMPPGTTFIMPVHQGQFPPAFGPGAHGAMYPTHFNSGPPPGPLRFPKHPSGGSESGSSPNATGAYIGSPPPLFQSTPVMHGYPPDMVGHYQPPILIPAPPVTSTWNGDNTGDEHTESELGADQDSSQL
ncbi:hypothetical protein DFS34DRAFT_662196 [Phlyctochytrium arcticum]|nr:hypothetical protein DFS34DRAFT_662196 [Phlyctochytrium arcticum]